MVCCQAIGAILGFALLAYGFVKYKEKTAILNTPTSTVRGLAVGLAEVVGKAEGSETTQTIIEGKQAVFHKWILERWQSGRKRGDWVIVKQGEFRKNFFINDGTGRLLVDPAGANAEVTPVSWAGTFAEAPERVKKFFEENQVKTSVEFFGHFEHRFRLQELVIEPGETVYAIGTVQDRLGEYTVGSENLVMVQNKGQGSKVFCISDRSEKQVLEKHYKWVWAYLVIGFIISGFSVLSGIIQLIGATFGIGGLLGKICGF